jgi:hypothetical protein
MPPGRGVGIRDGMALDIGEVERSVGLAEYTGAEEKLSDHSGTPPGRGVGIRDGMGLDIGEERSVGLAEYW